jgi:DNA-binding NarL/FixJ family response regulator/signal transduction histidine kinase
VLEALCGSLRLPFAAVRFGTTEAAGYGTPPELLHSTVLTYDGSRIGELVVGLRTGQPRLSPPDIAVLELLAGPLAVALHATALSAALQESRLSIVAAREEERRRLRRDLHDGLGPALTGIAFKADAARNTLGAAPAQASELLGELRTDTTAAIADIRRLVYDLRPPALDDLGLIGSVRQQSALLAQRPDGGSVPVLISAPEDLPPPLPAAVEVAAYRIITEAMTNAARHAGATRIEVRLMLAGGGGLYIEVRDDGGRQGGAAPGWQPGVGLISMRERAAELGGSCEAGPDPGGGGRVTATLPLIPPGGTAGPCPGGGERAMTGDIRVVIADDHPVVRDGLSALLSSVPSMTVAGLAGTGHEAVQAAVTLRPDVLIMDIQMPELNGVGATREIARAAPDVAVLMLTMFDDDDSVLAAMRAGARGYVLKGAHQEEIVRAIQAVAAGEAIFGPGIARRVLGLATAPAAASAPFPELTGREREVLGLIAAGVRNAEIARRMALAPKTVANHVSAIFAKLQVADRNEAIILARDAGLGRGGPAG